MTRPPEFKDTVRRMWADGEKLDTIAHVLGCTRGVISGLISRMGLQKMPKPRGQSKGNPAPIQRARQRPNIQTINVRAARLHASGPPALAVERFHARQHVAPEATRKTLLGLSGSDCRFPCGTPGEESFFFCGAPQAEGRPYCGDHCRIAYQTKGTDRASWWGRAHAG